MRRLLRTLAVMEIITGCSFVFVVMVMKFTDWMDIQRWYLVFTAQFTVFIALFVAERRGFVGHGYTFSKTELIITGTTSIGFASTLMLYAIVMNGLESQLLCCLIGLVLLLTGFGILFQKPWGWLLNVIILAFCAVSMVYMFIHYAPREPLILVLLLPLLLALLSILRKVVHPEILRLFFKMNSESIGPSKANNTTTKFRISYLSLWPIAIIQLVFYPIFIPNAINLMNRNCQIKTVGLIGQIVSSAKSYANDHGHYPDVKTIGNLAKLLTPTYIKELPQKDGWGWPFAYHYIHFPITEEPNILAGSKYIPRDGIIICSPGRDGIFEFEDPRKYPGLRIEDVDKDIVSGTTGHFQWPACIAMR